MSLYPIARAWRPSLPVSLALAYSYWNGMMQMNPWFSIWFRPQKTIAEIVADNPKRLVPDLAVIAGFAYALGRAFEKDAGDKVGLLAIIIIAFLAGAINGWLFLYIASYLVHLTGKWLKGEAPIEHIRAAISWANIPKIWSLGLWIIAIAIFQLSLFQSDTTSIENNIYLLIPYSIFALFLVVIQLWVLILTIRCVGQVQKFSLWKSISNIVMSGLIIFIPIVIFLLVAAKFMES